MLRGFKPIPPYEPLEISQWLTAHSDLLPKTLALDGKDLGGKGKLGAVATLCHPHRRLGQSRRQPLPRSAASGKPHPPLSAKERWRAKQETRHFILSIEEGKHSHARLAQIGRDHGSVETRTTGVGMSPTGRKTAACAANRKARNT